jgi:uncharacterized integral membrane protein
VTRAGVLLALVIGLVLVAWRFAVANGEPVAIDLWLWSRDAVPLWVALLVSFAAGATLVGVFWAYGGVRARLTERRYRKTVASLESEIHQLRNLPLAPEGGEAARTAQRESLSGGA